MGKIPDTEFRLLEMLEVTYNALNGLIDEHGTDTDHGVNNDGASFGYGEWTLAEVIAQAGVILERAKKRLYDTVAP